MKRPDDRTRLSHMLEAACTAVEFTAGRRRNELAADKKLDLSLTRLLEVLGEAAKGVSSDIRDRYPLVPWNQIVGIRNILAHAYFDVDMEIIWKVVMEDLPPLIGQLKSIIAVEFENDNTRL